MKTSRSKLKTLGKARYLDFSPKKERTESWKNEVGKVVEVTMPRNIFKMIWKKLELWEYGFRRIK